MQFKIMVTCPEILEEAIKIQNKFNNTDFEIIETIYDEVPFCTLKVTKYKIEDVFGLARKLSTLEYKMREDGKLGW